MDLAARRAIRCCYAPLLVGILTGCQLMSLLEDEPCECHTEGEVDQLPCGPCNVGLLNRVCRDCYWEVRGECINPYDVDADGYSSFRCFEVEVDTDCCDPRDCDDENPNRWPGHADLDGDLHEDVSCGGDDCNDDDPLRWGGHADLDGDGYDDISCGGDDCNDDDPQRWGGRADLDGDGYNDIACGGDDCNDDDPSRWGGHADLDGDFHADISCGGDDCNDDDPSRWGGHADLDGDGKTDMRCCLPGEVCTDCNDDDPMRWADNADLDGDGYDEFLCCTIQGYSPDECDCDDTTSSSSPSQPPSADHSSLDRDCDGLVDSLSIPVPCVPTTFDVIDTLSTIGTAYDVCAVKESDSATNVYVATFEGVLKVKVTNHGTWAFFDVTGQAQTGITWGVMAYGDHLYAATSVGLFVLDARETPHREELVPIAGPVGMYSARSVFVSRSYAYVATIGGLTIVNVLEPANPRIVSDPLRAVRFMDVFVTETYALLAAYPASGESDVGGFYRAEVSQPDLPTLVEVEGSSDRHSMGIHVREDTAYLVSHAGLDIWDLEPDEPSLLATVDVGEAEDVFVVGDTALVVGEEGLCVVNVAAPSSPVVTRICTGDAAHGIYYLGGLAYIASDAGLEVVNLNCAHE